MTKSDIIDLPRVQEARRRLNGIAHITPLDYSKTFSELTGSQVYFKLENLQKTGSFKIRGAYNKISSLSEAEKARGVIAASAGNHAQGVAYAAYRAGIKATIVVPEGAPISKIEATRGYGAGVILAEGGYDEAFRHIEALQKEKGATLIHGFDDPDIIAGQGTIGFELLEAMPELDMVVVPIGGGGLMAGTAYVLKQLKPAVRVIGVQAAGAAAMQMSYQARELIETATARTIADGIAVRRPGHINFELVSRFVDEIVTVEDEEIARAILMLLERSKLVVEGAGAVGLAALLHHKIPAAGLKVACILSGGNIDVYTVSLIIERGLVKSGRYLRLRTVVADRPGSLHRLLQVITKTRANVIAINHDRITPQIALKQAELELALETRNQEHIENVMAKLTEAGYPVEQI